MAWRFLHVWKVRGEEEGDTDVRYKESTKKLKIKKCLIELDSNDGNQGNKGI